MMQQGTYKDVAAQILENDELRVTVLPDWGSKISSIVYKSLGYELLYQNPSEKYNKTSYADSYLEGELAGFDEMFPTITRCFYEDHPWQGVEMPDHGEVWTLPWTHESQGNELVMTVRGVRFAYRLQKRVSLEGSSILIRYEAENLSPERFEFIWAAHPLFNAVPGMEFKVPEGMDRVVNAYPGKRLGSYGRAFDFPAASMDDGTVFRLDRMPEQNDFGYQKYFFLTPVTEGWCSLGNPDNGLLIHLEYPKKTVRYLGMWLNEGGFAGQYNIAPEPATAAMDRVDFSRAWDMNSVLGGYETRKWYLNIAVTT